MPAGVMPCGFRSGHFCAVIILTYMETLNHYRQRKYGQQQPRNKNPPRMLNF